jgi:hypothetical protein
VGVMGKKIFFTIFLMILFLIFSGCVEKPSRPLPKAEMPSTPSPERNVEELVCQAHFCVEIYNPEKTYHGTTFFVYKYAEPDIMYEIDMRGNVIWEYQLPPELGGEQTEAELLPGNTVLLVIPRKGLYEIDRKGNVLWYYEDPKVSHDADRLPNGNTIYVYGMNDKKTDAQVKEVTPDGKLVWEWYAKDHFDYAPYSEIDPVTQHGWCHTNAVTRLDNGNTLISIRNFDMIVEVNSKGEVVRTIEGVVSSPHDPAILDNGNILAVHQTPTYHAAVEINPETKEIVWEYGFNKLKDFPIRDANRLPNGNTLITGARRIIEVTEEGEIVWQLALKDDITFSVEEAAGYGFYKAERIASK